MFCCDSWKVALIRQYSGELAFFFGNYHFKCHFAGNGTTVQLNLFFFWQPSMTVTQHSDISLSDVNIAQLTLVNDHWTQNCQLRYSRVSDLLVSLTLVYGMRFYTAPSRQRDVYSRVFKTLVIWDHNSNRGRRVTQAVCVAIRGLHTWLVA